MPEIEKNAYLQNGLFFFSNMYDDKLLTEFYPKICRENWKNSIRYQYDTIGRRRNMDYNPSLVGAANPKNLTIDNILNAKLGLPVGSSTVKLTNVVIPYHNKKGYIRKYGAIVRKIPLNDFITENKIFDGILSVYIGRFRIQKALIVENNDQSVYLAIPNSETDGITSDKLKQLIADAAGDNGGDLATPPGETPYPDITDATTLILIFNEELCRTFHTNLEVKTAFSNTATDGYYKMTIPLSSEISKIKPQLLHEEANSWDVFICANGKKYGVNAMVGDSATLEQQLTDTIVFNVKEEFINYIKSQNKAKVEILVLKRQNRRYINIYADITEYKGTYAYLPYTFNPSSFITFGVYKYDNVNHCRLGRIDFSLHRALASIQNSDDIDTPLGFQVIFPNIISFDKIFEALKTSQIGSIEIEVYEYYPTHTNQIMHNGLNDIITNLTPDFYTKCAVNNYLPELALNKFDPKLEKVSLEDYKNSLYYGNIRAYYCSKIIEMLKADPSLIRDYYSYMQQLNRRVYAEDGTPKSFRFGTKKTGEHKGSHDIVMDTSVSSMIIDDVQHFDEEHSYIIYHSSDDKIPSMFFVNGKSVEPTCTRYYKGEMYLFFPTKIMDELDVYDEETIKKVLPLRLEWFPNSYSSYGEAPKDSFTITSMDQEVNLFGNIKNPEFALSDITLYDNITKEYINLHDAFDVVFEATQVMLDNPFMQDIVVVDRAESSKQYLYTLLKEIYCTKDAEPIILEENTIDISYDSEIKKMG